MQNRTQIKIRKRRAVNKSQIFFRNVLEKFRLQLFRSNSAWTFAFENEANFRVPLKTTQHVLFFSAWTHLKKIRILMSVYAATLNIKDTVLLNVMYVLSLCRIVREQRKEGPTSKETWNLYSSERAWAWNFCNTLEKRPNLTTFHERIFFISFVLCESKRRRNCKIG